MPQVQSEAEFASAAFGAVERKDWLQEVWGKWPGDEPVEEILQELKR